jgi:putative salt-induced outer membrane protein YdiY
MMRITKYRYRLKTPSVGLLALGALVLAVCGSAARADEVKVDPDKKEKKWESVATVGLTLTRGNSQTFLGSGSIATKRNFPNDEVLFGASAGYGETTTRVNGNEVDTTTDSYVKGYGQYNHLFTPVIYAGLRITGEHDDVAHLTYRTTISPLAGYYFIKQTNTFLCADIGPSYVREKFFGEDVHDYIGLRLGERGEHKFKNGAKVWETVEYIPKLQDFQNYLINAEIGVSAPIQKSFNVSLVLQDTYKSVPAIGKEKNDLKLIAGLGFNF